MADIPLEITRGLALDIGDLLVQRKQTLAVAESCTGGLLADIITSNAGSSMYFIGGVVAYDRRIKKEVLRVPKNRMTWNGVVSESVAARMARGVRRLMSTDWGVGITGVAGPGTGDDFDIPGKVCVAVVSEGKQNSRTRYIEPKTLGKVEARGLVKLMAAQATLWLLRYELGKIA